MTEHTPRAYADVNHAEPTFAYHSPCRAPLEAPSVRPRRPWRAKFADAFRGLKLGIRGHSSFFVHFFFAALVVAAAVVLRCTLVEWCILLGCIGLVLTVELVNSAIETLFHNLDEATRRRAKACLDIAAAPCCSPASRQRSLGAWSCCTVSS